MPIFNLNHTIIQLIYNLIIDKIIIKRNILYYDLLNNSKKT